MCLDSYTEANENLSKSLFITVFALDKAFDKCNAVLDAILSFDTELLKHILLIYRMSGDVISKDVTNNLSVARVEVIKLKENVSSLNITVDLSLSM